MLLAVADSAEHLVLVAEILVHSGVKMIGVIGVAAKHLEIVDKYSGRGRRRIKPQKLGRIWIQAAGRQLVQELRQGCEIPDSHDAPVGVKGIAHKPA